ncbi:modification methylase, partial [Salmonella enterica]|nr:modification methylase [Salmonella enterica]
MVPNGTYILIKRLTSKEEKRRIVAGLYTESIADVEMVGFENKTNYLHAKGKPLDFDMAKGLWVYLNSNLVDQYFRQFNGHTQVNAADLYTIRYPNREQLINMGKQACEFNQDSFDKFAKAL